MRNARTIRPLQSLLFVTSPHRSKNGSTAQHSILHVHTAYFAKKNRRKTVSPRQRRARAVSHDQIPPIRFREKRLIQQSQWADAHARPPKTELLRMRSNYPKTRPKKPRIPLRIITRSRHCERSSSAAIHSSFFILHFSLISFPLFFLLNFPTLLTSL